MPESPGRYQLLIDWIEEDGNRKTSWEPFDRINNDVPHLVEQFFRTQVMKQRGHPTYEEVLTSEVEMAASAGRGYHRGDGGV